MAHCWYTTEWNKYRLAHDNITFLRLAEILNEKYDLGTYKQALSDFFAGKHMFPEDVLNAVCDFYGVDVITGKAWAQDAVRHYVAGKKKSGSLCAFGLADKYQDSKLAQLWTTTVKENHLTMADAADLFGISVTTLKNWWIGASVPNSAKIKEVSNFLGMPEKELLHLYKIAGEKIKTLEIDKKAETKVKRTKNPFAVYHKSVNADKSELIARYKDNSDADDAFLKSLVEDFKESFYFGLYGKVSAKEHRDILKSITDLASAITAFSLYGSFITDVQLLKEINFLATIYLHYLKTLF